MLDYRMGSTEMEKNHGWLIFFLMVELHRWGTNSSVRETNYYISIGCTKCILSSCSRGFSYLNGLSGDENPMQEK
jgi:hypothetical protein